MEIIALTFIHDHVGEGDDDLARLGYVLDDAFDGIPGPGSEPAGVVQ